MAGKCLGLSTRNSEQWRNAILAGWLFLPADGGRGTLSRYPKIYRRHFFVV